MLSLFLSNTFLEQHLVLFFSVKEKGRLKLRILRALSGTNSIFPIPGLYEKGFSPLDLPWTPKGRFNFSSEKGRNAETKEDPSKKYSAVIKAGS